MRRNIIAAIACGLFLAACTLPLLFAGDPRSAMAGLDAEIAASKEGEFASHYYALLKAGDVQAVSTLTEINGAKAADIFASWRKYMPDAEPQSVRFIGKNTIRLLAANGFRRTDVTLEYVFPEKAIITDVNLEDRGDSFRVIGYSIKPYKASLEHLAEFTFYGQDAKHYGILAASIVLLALNAYALVVWIKKPNIRLKWLWLIILFLGLGKVEYNWATGITYYFGDYGKGFSFDFIKAPIVSYALQIYQPFVITMAIPVGTLAFLIWHGKWPKSAETMSLLRQWVR